MKNKKNRQNNNSLFEEIFMDDLQDPEQEGLEKYGREITRFVGNHTLRMVGHA